MASEQNCKSCNHWKPKYHGVGICTEEGSNNAKFWVAEQKELFTVASFCCQSFIQIQDVKDSTI